MNSVRIINTTHPLNQQLIVDWRQTFWGRFRGLMFTNSLNSGCGILMDELVESILAATIHMMFMNFDIVVVWIDQNKKVVDIKEAKKWALYLSPSRPAQFILELHKDRFPDFECGDQLKFEQI